MISIVKAAKDVLLAEISGDTAKGVEIDAQAVQQEVQKVDRVEVGKKKKRNSRSGSRKRSCSRAKARAISTPPEEMLSNGVVAQDRWRHFRVSQ